MLLAASGFSTGYDIVKSLHILAAIIGFGAVFFNALYGFKAKQKRGAEAAFLAHTVYDVSKVAEWFIYAVFVLGFAALGMAPDNTWKFSQTWVWLSVLLYVVGIGLSHAIVLPNARAINALMDELAAGPPPAAGAAASGPPPQALELEERGKRQATVAMVLDCILVVIVFLMVMKPGV